METSSNENYNVMTQMYIHQIKFYSIIAPVVKKMRDL